MPVDPKYKSGLGSILGGPFDLVNRVSKVGYEGL